MTEKNKKYYPYLCILLLISSFLFLFRNKQFIWDPEFLFTTLPQAAFVRHISLLGNFWNSYSGCGVPFFPAGWSKFYFVLNIFFRFFDPRTAYILFLISGFILNFFVFYYSANYFYRNRYASTLLSLLYVSSGLLYGFFSANYQYIEYFTIMPLIVMVLHKYIDKKNNLYLILLGFLTIYAYSSANIVSAAMFLFLINLFTIFLAYDKHKKITAVIYRLFLINTVVIGVNLFKIIPIVQYYLIEGARPRGAYFQDSLYGLLGPLHFLFLSGHFPINLHYLSLFLLLAFLFYPTKPIERTSLKVFICYIVIIYTVYIILYLLNFNIVKTIALYKILLFAHVPGILMLGAGVRSFILNSDRKKELKALIVFGLLWTILYLLYVIKKQSFDIAIMQNCKWPFLFGLSFFLMLFISENTQFRKICAIIIILIYAMAFIHTGESSWTTDNTYQETYLNKHNKEILTALEVRPPGSFTKNKVDDLYRIMAYGDKKLELVNLPHEEKEKIPFFATQNYPILFGIRTVHQFDNVFLRRYLIFTEILNNSNNSQHPNLNNNALLSPLFPFLNVKYLFSYNNIREKGFSLIKTLDEGTKIYKNNNLLPRIFIVDSCISYNSKEEFIKIISGSNIDFTKTALIEGYTLDANTDTGTLDYKIKSLTYKNDSIKFDLSVNKDSFLVILDNYYPGWKAYVNKKQTQIYPAYFTFRAIHLPEAGEYKIEFRYLPTFFVKGVSIATAIFMLLTLGLFLQRRKRVR